MIWSYMECTTVQQLTSKCKLYYLCSQTFLNGLNGLKLILQCWYTPCNFCCAPTTAWLNYKYATFAGTLYGVLCSDWIIHRFLISLLWGIHICRIVSSANLIFTWFLSGFRVVSQFWWLVHLLFCDDDASTTTMKWNDTVNGLCIQSARLTVWIVQLPDPACCSTQSIYKCFLILKWKCFTVLVYVDSYPISWWMEDPDLLFFITRIAITMTVTTKTITTITGTTPPTMAPALSSCAGSAEVQSDVEVIFSVPGVSRVDTEGTTAVSVVHSGSPKVLIAKGQLLSIRTRTPCMAMVVSVWATQVLMFVNSCELVAWAVPCSLARNVTWYSEFAKHWNAYSVMWSVLSPHRHCCWVFRTTALMMSVNLALVATPYRNKADQN